MFTADHSINAHVYTLVSTLTYLHCSPHTLQSCQFHPMYIYTLYVAVCIDCEGTMYYGHLNRQRDPITYSSMFTPLLQVMKT